MNEVKDRIYQFTKTRGIPIRMFEELCGMSNGYVSSMRKGLGNEKLNNVLKVFPDISREWLLFGEGEMLKQVPANVQIGNGNTNQQGDNTTTTTTNNYSNGCERAGKVNEEIMNRMLESLSEQSKKHLELLDKALSIDRDLEEIKGMIKQVLDRIN